MQSSFDGYTLYTMMSYSFVDGERINVITRGIFFGIPIRGYTGWICNTSINGDDTTCESRFIDSSDFISGQADEIYLPIEAASYEEVYNNFENGNWICDTDYESDLITAKCTAWLPSDEDESTHPSIYRFESGNSYSVYGYAMDRDIADDSTLAI